jgi:indolepyruvate ferredoxin oxidoreductase
VVQQAVSRLTPGMGAQMSQRIVTLDDKYALDQGRVFLTGIQALVRLPLDQKRRDRAAGLNTGGFISGYRGSPLGGYDQQIRRAEKYMKAHDVHLWEGLNEDLGATAVWGSQQVGVMPGARFDGVFGIWYGKAPGVDRTGDVFKHANFAGVSEKGGVLAIAGDDHACKSSTLPSQSEFAFADAEIPVLSPSSVQEVLDYGLFGLAMSRYSGLWTGMIALADTMDSGAVIEVGGWKAPLAFPAERLAPGAVGLRQGDKPMDKEARMRLVKLPAAHAFIRANGLDRVVLAASRPRIGIVATGQAVRDVFEAFEAIGVSEAQLAAAGVSIFKVAMPWPLEPAAIREFSRGLETVLVVEHKRDLIEHQLKAVLYDLPEAQRPRVIGKRDAHGAPLLSELSALPIPVIARALQALLPAEARAAAADAYFARVAKSLEAADALHTDIVRKAHYCSGCPHSTSTVVPEGSRALAGIGCHYLATFMNRADFTSQMGGEGVAWIGQAPYTDEQHVFVNLGDGTYSHSGSLAIRAAVSAGVSLTYKILYNGAVAMTGGQDVESGQTVAQLVHQLRGEGVAKVVVVAEDPDRHIQQGELGPLVDIYPRDRLDEVQRDLRAVPGITVIIYDQVCATERRRKAKRGLVPLKTKRAFINTAVCEGCGDCSVQSNCLSVEPVETELGTKRRINQSSCNQDLRCVDGFCPSFVTLEGAANAKRDRTVFEPDTDDLPDVHPPAIDHAYNILFTGVGGTGVTTIAAILGMAAHIEGLGASTLDMTGLAQKGGAVTSHIRIARTPDQIRSGRTPPASADVIIGGDLVVAAGADALALLDAARSRAVVNLDVIPTAAFVSDRTLKFEGGPMRRKLEKAVAKLDSVNAEGLAEELLFDQLYSNMIMLGFAWGKGLVPVSQASLTAAITLNGAGVKENLRAFAIGRIAAQAPERLPSQAPARPPAPAKSLDETIAHRRALLTAYQNAAYAARYLELVDAVRARETELGLGEKLAFAVAQNFAKLMAYKDEYEVARLYSNGDWQKALKDTFGGDPKITFHLAPPLIAKKDKVTGHLKKQAFGAWMLPAFKTLAGLKHLRGGALDVFGKTAERRMERGLRDAYEADIVGLLAGLSAADYDLVVRLANLPDQIRGFGHVKEGSVVEAEAERATLKAAISAARAAPTLAAKVAAE